MMLPSSTESIQNFAIPAAFVLDALVGDPRLFPHPVRWMGRCIQSCEPVFRRLLKNKYMAGTLFAAVLILGTWGLTSLVIMGAQKLNPMMASLLEIVMIFFCLSSRSLAEAGMEIYRLLTAGSVAAARLKVSMIVGRDVEHYAADDIARATVETVAENFVDGVLSPLFFAVIGGAPMAMAYKMVNTLDSMVGYRNQDYHQFGWASARIDDAANFIPARLSMLVISLSAWVLTRKRGRKALLTAVKEGAHHSSPNAGYPEAAFAGALAVKLNGPNYYDGALVDKPYIGAAFRPVEVHHIRKACELMTVASLAATVLAWSAAWMRF